MIASSMAAGFVLTLVSASACGGESTGGAGRTRDVADAGAQHPIAAVDARAPRLDASATSAGGAPTIPLTDPFQCQSDERVQVLDTLRQRGCPACERPNTVPYGVTIDAQGNVVDVVSKEGGAVPDAVRQCYLAALAAQKFPCLSGEDVWYECVTILR